MKDMLSKHKEVVIIASMIIIAIIIIPEVIDVLEDILDFVFWWD